MSGKLISCWLSYPFSALGQFVLILLLFFLGAMANLRAGAFCLTAFPISFCSGCCLMKFQSWTHRVYWAFFLRLGIFYLIFSLLIFLRIVNSLFRTSMTWLIFYLSLCLTVRPRLIFAPINFLSLSASKQFTQPLLRICAQPGIYFLSCPVVQIPPLTPNTAFKMIVLFAHKKHHQPELPGQAAFKTSLWNHPENSPLSSATQLPSFLQTLNTGSHMHQRRWCLLPFFSACL